MTDLMWVKEKERQINDIQEIWTIWMNRLASLEIWKHKLRI
jgi:hypothetical protein